MRGWWASRWPVLLATALLARALDGPVPVPIVDPRSALSAALARDLGLLLDESTEPLWVDGTSGGSCWFGGRRALVAARQTPSAPRDVFLIRASWSPEQHLIEVCAAHNLTETEAADEDHLIGRGPEACWRLTSQGLTYRVECADLRGQTLPEAGWTGLARVQQRLTALQSTGQLRGVVRRSFRLEPAVRDLRSSWSKDGLWLLAPGWSAQLPGAGSDAPLPPPLIEQVRELGQPSSLLQWSVDRARQISWLGVDRVQWLKAVAFRGLDWAEQRFPSAPSEDVFEATDLAPAPAPGARAEPNASGWPPPPLQVVAQPALPGEGEWRSIEGDRFVTQRPGLPPAIYTSFVRPDPVHDATRVLIALWDPRRIDLHFATGTEEPKSATGEVGSGLIPRDPAVLSRLIGAFNGGFQTSHGAWGTFADDKLYVPPRPFAATVARFEDGSVGFGTWPTGAAIPEELDSFRQNLTPLVSQGRFNPYERQWWGGVPIGWKDTTRTVRSALCATREGFVAYFYGSRADHVDLGQALLLARCEYGIHLDMNSGHTGFEFYSVVPASEPPLAHEELATRWKAEGPVPDLPGYRYRARRLFRNMQLMHFPRYLQRQTRDFFYLTERRVLPEPPIGAQWSSGSHSDRAFPHAIASAELRPDPRRPGTTVRLIELDLKWLAVHTAEAARPPAGTVFSVAAPSEDHAAANRALWVEAGAARFGSPERGTSAVAHAAGGAASAAWGLVDGQVLAYAQVTSEPDATRDGPLIAEVLARAGCTAVMHTELPRFSAVDGATDLHGNALDRAALAATGQPALHFVRQDWRALRPLFPETPIVSPAVWQPHQP
jgi:hypothetical protein